MTLVQAFDSTGEGRFARTAVLAVLAGNWGAIVFKNVDDALVVAPFFVLTTLTTAALAHEVLTQARRRSRDSAASWERTDTANLVVLVGLTVLSSAPLAFRSFSPPEQSAALGFAALYAVLAGIFAWTRRKALRQPSS
jgi:protein-S-isoprenylcysteine O-methyltransferase Ste14